MIGWGIIGCGKVTEVKSGPALYKTPGSRLVRVMRRDAAKTRDFAERHGVPRWGTDAQAVIDDPEVDVVYVATPTASHAGYTLAAARAGKHVLVEKPMASTVAECRAMVAACDEAGTKLWVAYYRRTLPRFAKIRDLVGNGALGTVLSVQTTWRKPGPLSGWRWDPEVNPGGEFFETACHTLDFLDQLLGPISSPEGKASEEDRVVVAGYQFPGAALGVGAWTFGAPDARDSTVVTGTDASLRFASFRPDPIVVRRGDKLTEYAVPDPPHVHAPLIASIVGELNGGPRCPSTGRTAARTASVMEQILSSAHGRR